MRTEIRFAGVGGQGNIAAGEWVAMAAHELGYHALQSPTYTAQVRGGPTSVDVLISDAPIVYPRLVDIDFMLCLAQSAWDIFAKQIRPNGIIVVDPNLVSRITPGPQTVYQIPIGQITKQTAGKPVYTSAVVLGVFCRLMPVISKNAMIEIITKHVPPDTVETNLLAFHAGWNALDSVKPATRDALAQKLVEA